MTKQTWRCGVTAEIDSFGEQISCDDNSAPGYLRDHTRIIADSR